jgi:hypothetical protein
VRDRPKRTGTVPSGLGPLSEKVSGPELGPDMDLIAPESQVISQFTLMAQHRVKSRVPVRSGPLPAESVRTCESGPGRSVRTCESGFGRECPDRICDSRIARSGSNSPRGLFPNKASVRTGRVFVTSEERSVPPALPRAHRFRPNSAVEIRVLDPTAGVAAAPRSSFQARGNNSRSYA